MVDREKVRCYNCQEMGHYSNECTNDNKERADEDGTMNMAIGAGASEHDDVIIGADRFEYDDVDEFTFVNHSGEPGENNSGADAQDYYDADSSLGGYAVVTNPAWILPAWILLDSQSTTDIFSNASLLTDIHESGKSINIHCNAGTSCVTKVGTLRKYGEVWYNENAIANILSLARVKERYPVKYDSTNGNQFIVIQPTKEVIFHQSQSGLYYHGTNNRAVVMVSTVAENRKGYTQQEYNDAKQARRALGMVGYPSNKDFNNMVRSNMIKNCPVTPKIVSAANKSFGPNIASVKGKKTRRKPEPVVTDYVEIPKAILDLNKDVALTADVMFVDGIPFLVTNSRKIKFTTS
jgi:hypothetical protein